MILYHGSNVSVAEIDLGMSNVGKDFGCGFYLTPYEQHALREENGVSLDDALLLKEIENQK